MDAGTVVDGRYEVRRPLSIRGGMGDVYLCLDQRLKREVAVKLIKPEHASAPEYRERFQREVDAAIALEGHDVVRIYDHGECAERHIPYCVMEYLRGRDLSQELALHGPLELVRALTILLEVCRVISAAHERKIIHRDLKPSNLFLEGPPSPRCSVRVLDFGIAKVLDDPRDGAITQLGGQPGSPNYMAPEQHRNEPRVDVGVDIWALGAILFEALTGEKAWPGEAHAARKRVLLDATPKVRSKRPELPQELDHIIGKCLQKDAADRYAAIQELEQDLRQLQATVGLAEQTLPTVAVRPTRRAGKAPLPWPWMVALSGLGIVIGSSFTKIWQQPSVAPALAAADTGQLTGRALAADISDPGTRQLLLAAEAEQARTLVAAESEQLTRLTSEPVVSDVAAPTQTNQSEQTTKPSVAKASTDIQTAVRTAISSGRTKPNQTPGISSVIYAPSPNAQPSPRLSFAPAAPQIPRTETRLKTE